MLVKMRKNGNPGTLLVGIEIGAATVEDSTEVSQKVKNRTTTRPGNSIPGCVYRKKMKTLI